MARFEDAVQGWEIFRSRNGNVSRAQLNAALRQARHEPISLRTFAHYHKLLRLGYHDYVSINRLDLRHANDSVFDIADRSRYTDTPHSGPVRLVVPLGGRTEIFRGVLQRLSEGFALASFPMGSGIDSIAKATKWNRGVLVFEEVDVERAVKVVEATPRGDVFDVLLEFRSLLETDLVLALPDIELTESRLVVNLGASASLFKIVEITQLSFTLMESARGFAELTLQLQGREGRQLPTPRVRSMSFSNPWELVFFGGSAAAAVIGFTLKQVGPLVRDLSAAGKTAAETVAITHQDNRDQERHDLEMAGERARQAREAERHEVEMDSLNLDRVKAAIEVEQLAQAVAGAGSDDGRSDLASSQVARLEPLKDQAVEAAGELTLLSRGLVFDEGNGDAEQTFWGVSPHER